MIRSRGNAHRVLGLAAAEAGDLWQRLTPVPLLLQGFQQLLPALHFIDWNQTACRGSLST